MGGAKVVGFTASLFRPESTLAETLALMVFRLGLAFGLDCMMIPCPGAELRDALITRGRGAPGGSVVKTASWGRVIGRPESSGGMEGPLEDDFRDPELSALS